MGLQPSRPLALYAKVKLFLTTQNFKTVKNFSVKSGAFDLVEKLKNSEETNSKTEKKQLSVALTLCLCLQLLM